MPDYTKLYFDTIGLTATSSTVTAAPHFHCPNCGYVWSQNQTITARSNTTTDFNMKVAFKCPSCVSTITLFVAVHRDPTLGTLLCFQKSSEEGINGIPTNWWQTL